MNFSTSFKIVFQEGLIFLLFVIVVGLFMALSGCNTVKGVGEDISGSATFVQHKMSGDTNTSSPSTSYKTTEGVNPPQWPSSTTSVD